MSPGDVSAEQARLRADMEAARVYAGEHPDERTDVRWYNEPTVRIEVRFVDHLDEPRAALADLVERAERLEVASACFTDTELSRVLADVCADFRGRGLSEFPKTVDNRGALRPPVLRRRGRRRDAHGRRVPYPLDGATARPVREPPATDGSPPARLSLVRDEPPLPAGDDGHD